MWSVDVTQALRPASRLTSWLSERFMRAGRRSSWSCLSALKNKKDFQSFKSHRYGFISFLNSIFCIFSELWSLSNMSWIDIRVTIIYRIFHHDYQRLTSIGKWIMGWGMLYSIECLPKVQLIVYQYTQAWIQAWISPVERIACCG